MKLSIPLIGFICLANLSLAQLHTDTVTQSTDLPQLPDSVKTAWQEVDSIRNNFNTDANALKSKYDQSVSSIDRQTSALNQSIDSLQNLNLPSSRLATKVDSLNQKRNETKNDFNSKVDKLKSETVGKISKVEMTPEMQGPVGEFTQKINGFDLSNNKYAEIPALQIPGYSLPKVEGLADLTGDLKNVGNIAGLPEIKTPLGDVTQATDQLKGVSQDVKSISQGNLNDVQQLPETIEKQAANIEGVDELQKQSGLVEDYKEQLTNLNDPAAIKKQAAEMARKEAINHFAGKEEQLQTALNKMSKYKKKYSEVSSVRDLPKRPPNAMKGKPFVERLVPGIYLQYQQKNALMFDFNPYVGYRISGRFTPGLGWNQRYAYEKKTKEWPDKKMIYGPRAFLDTRLGKGFIAHIEQEAMNTFVPSTIVGNPDQGHREWVWSTMVGLKKEYKIYRNLKGTVLLQFNLFNPYFKAPYVDRLNSRLGFEYQIKKRVKKQSPEKQE